MSAPVQPAEATCHAVVELVADEPATEATTAELVRESETFANISKLLDDVEGRLARVRTHDLPQVARYVREMRRELRNPPVPTEGNAA